jgi:mannosylglycerate hydrolase
MEAQGRRVHLAWRASDVPPCGYAAFDVAVAEGPANGVGPGFPYAPVTAGPDCVAGPAWVENARLRVDVRGDGTLDVRDKSSGVLYASCLALEDMGDAGDEYNYSPPRRDLRVTSADVAAAKVTVVHGGPLRAALRIELGLKVPEALATDRSARSGEDATIPVSLLVELDAGSARLTCTATLDNAARDHRLRVLFPTGAARVEEARADTAFGTVRRPARRPVPDRVATEAPVSAAPLQSFVDAGDDRAGVTVYADGLMEYEVLTDGPPRVALTLLRCVGELSRGDLRARPGGHAGPGLPTPGAQCPGRHVFRFAMEPRAAAPAEADLHARARAFVAPPRVVAPAGGDGSLPKHLSFLTFQGAEAAVLSACKKAEDRDAVVVRLFNPGDDEVRVTIGGFRPLARAFALDLLERRVRELPIQDGRAAVVLAKRRIETVELVPAARATRPGPPPSARG